MHLGKKKKKINEHDNTFVYFFLGPKLEVLSAYSWVFV